MNTPNTDTLKHDARDPETLEKGPQPEGEKEAKKDPHPPFYHTFSEEQWAPLAPICDKIAALENQFLQLVADTRILGAKLQICHAEKEKLKAQLADKITTQNLPLPKGYTMREVDSAHHTGVFKYIPVERARPPERSVNSVMMELVKHVVEAIE